MKAGGEVPSPSELQILRNPSSLVRDGGKGKGKGDGERASPATCCTAGLTQSPSPQTFWGGEKRLDEDRGSSVSLLLDK